MTQLALLLQPRAKGEEAANACAAKAERVSNFDTDGAMKFIIGYLLRFGPQSGEELTDQAKRHGYRPHDDRCFGAVYSKAVRRKLIRCTGYCDRKKGNGTSGGRIWKAVL